MTAGSIDEVYGCTTDALACQPQLSPSAPSLLLRRTRQSSQIPRPRRKGGHAPSRRRPSTTTVIASHLVAGAADHRHRNADRVPARNRRVAHQLRDLGSKALHVIPETVHIKGTVRTMDRPIRDLPETRMRAIRRGHGHHLRRTATLALHAQLPGMVNLRIRRPLPPRSPRRRLGRAPRGLFGDRALMGVRGFRLRCSSRTPRPGPGTAGPIILVRAERKTGGSPPSVHHPKYKLQLTEADSRGCFVVGRDRGAARMPAPVTRGPGACEGGSQMAAAGGPRLASPSPWEVLRMLRVLWCCRCPDPSFRRSRRRGYRHPCRARSPIASASLCARGVCAGRVRRLRPAAARPRRAVPDRPEAAGAIPFTVDSPRKVPRGSCGRHQPWGCARRVAGPICRDHRGETPRPILGEIVLAPRTRPLCGFDTAFRRGDGKSGQARRRGPVVQTRPTPG